MPFMPFQVLGIWLRGLFSLALIGVGAYLLYDWYNHREVRVEAPVAAREAPPDAAGDRREVETRVAPWQFGLNRPTACLLGGLALLGWAFLGGTVVTPLLRKAGPDDPKEERTGAVQRVRRPDGTELQVESYGPEGAPTLVLTHGWGLNSSEWHYARRHLADRYRLIVWDLPGLGLSKQPDNRDFRLEKLAGDLEAVVELAGGRPVVLVGHSIGGMIIQTYCRLFAGSLGRRVAGLALVHTTYTNPAKTTKHRAFLTAVQKPLLEPLAHLMIWLAPLVWAMNWLSYLNGSMHRTTHKSSFCGHETRGQLDHFARLGAKAWPAVVARGFLGMFRFDEAATLGTIPVPTLVVAGDHDETTEPDASVHIAETIPTARLVPIDEAKHLGLIEHHQAWARLIDEFAANCLQAGRVGGPVGSTTA